MTPNGPPDCQAYIVLSNEALASLAGVFGGHEVRMKYHDKPKGISAWMMIQAGTLNETVEVSFWFNSAKATLPMGEVLTLSHIEEKLNVDDLTHPLAKKQLTITLLDRPIA